MGTALLKQAQLASRGPVFVVGEPRSLCYFRDAPRRGPQRPRLRGSGGTRSPLLRVTTPHTPPLNTHCHSTITGAEGQAALLLIRELAAAGVKVVAGVSDGELGEAVISFAKKYELIPASAAGNVAVEEVDLDDLAASIPRCD